MRKFSDEERAEIREDLIETGHELLLRYGPSKTTVKDITEPVGIAKPTFYQFFDAKADLYLEIFDREFEAFVEEVHAAVAEADGPQDRLEQFFRCYVEFAENNEFIQQVFLQDDYRDVMGNISQEKRVEMRERQIEAMLPTIESVQEQSDGPISEMEPFSVLGLLGSSLGLFVVHRDEIESGAAGEGFYDQMRETLVETLARGLTVEG